MNHLLNVEDLQKYFPIRTGLLGRVRQHVRAVDRISFQIQPGETLGLVGESGCGKTTVGRSILRLIEPTAGKVFFHDADVLKLKKHELRTLRRKMQIVFQDPYSSLNPRRVILDIVGEGLKEHRLVTTRRELEERVVTILESVGLSSQILYRYPHEFSGGQRQRIAIARAISLQPELIVCDEAVSALDVSIQAQIINLLMELRERLNIAYLFISHDLAVVKHISHRVAVMYLGQIVESAPTEHLFSYAKHPYTQALLSAVPIPDPRVRKERIILKGDVDNTRDAHVGCCFASRCPMVMDVCRCQEPPLYTESQHHVKCFRALPSQE